jgi:homoserine O-acetyltransferase
MRCGATKAFATSSCSTEVHGFRHPPLAVGWIDRPHLRAEIGDLPLESGEVLHDAFVSYVVHGDPSRLKDGAILVASAIGSTHHRLDFLIGAGAALDTDRHCVIAVDALGNGLSSSPSNSLRQPAGAFPRIALRDMVESQRRLLAQLGVGRLFAVVGASMGGMQALQWAVSHPDRMDRIVAMTPMARTARWSQLMNELSRRALFVDAACEVARAREEAMRLWVPLTQLVMVQTPEAVETFASPGALTHWLDDAAARLCEHGPDAFDWRCQTQAYDAHDVGATPGCNGSSAEALARIKARLLVLAPDLDLYNPVFEARDVVSATPSAKLVRLPGTAGHQSASGVESDSTRALRAAIADFLAE